jgi:tRNA pseudouridine55 synthase
MGDRGVSGWLVIDKPLGLSSSRVVEIVRRQTRSKVGHAGTLDPLATGVLPIAIGEATKMTTYAMAGRKRYRFRVRWGMARATDDREGEITAECDRRPRGDAIAAILPRFIGTIQQRPPAFSAIKMNGRRAYQLARAGEQPNPPLRSIEVSELRLLALPDADHADFEALVGKGTYIRALARDLGLALGTFAHVAELRRLSAGPFTDAQAVTLDLIAESGHISADCGYLLPIETALDGIPAVVLTGAEATRLCSGQKVVPADASGWADLDRFREGVVVSAWHGKGLVAVTRIEDGYLRPLRVINR